MAKTSAIRALEDAGVEFQICRYDYVEKGGTRASSAALCVEEHRVIKTLVLEDENRAPLIVLMHGDRKVSTKSLSRHIGVKKLSPCKPAVAQKHSGYQVGGTSPFGTKNPMPTYMQESILQLEHIYINGGKRGLLVRIQPEVVVQLLGPERVDVCA